VIGPKLCIEIDSLTISQEFKFTLQGFLLSAKLMNSQLKQNFLKDIQNERRNFV
jgi:hypothetical protein